MNRYGGLDNKCKDAENKQLVTTESGRSTQVKVEGGVPIKDEVIKDANSSLIDNGDDTHLHI